MKESRRLVSQVDESSLIRPDRDSFFSSNPEPKRQLCRKVIFSGIYTFILKNCVFSDFDHLCHVKVFHFYL